MDKNKFWFLILLTFLALGRKGFAQESAKERVNKSEISFLVHKIADSLSYYYVNKDEGIAIGNHLKNEFNNGIYNRIIKPDELARKLTQDLRSINGDLHLFVKYDEKRNEPNGNSDISSNNTKGLATNYGFQEIQFLADNIAYLRIEHFSNWDYASKARQKVAELMGLFKNSEALIIDVRDNRGGVP